MRANSSTQSEKPRTQTPSENSEPASSSTTVDYLPPTRSNTRSAALITSCTGALMVFVRCPNSSSESRLSYRFLQIGSTTAVSISMPSIGEELNIEQDKLQWLISAYSLSSGCLLLFCGRLADLYGRKLLFLSVSFIKFLPIFAQFFVIQGCIVQAVFSLGCAFAHGVWVHKSHRRRRLTFCSDELTIDVLRGLQGCGAAATVPAAVSHFRPKAVNLSNIQNSLVS